MELISRRVHPMMKFKMSSGPLAVGFLGMAVAIAIAAPKPAPKSTNHWVYSNYFESNQSGLKGQNSYLTFTTSASFDRVFHPTPLIGKSSFLPEDTFKSKMVVAVIKRGHSSWNYTVQQVKESFGTLTIRYKVTSTARRSAMFASPLIIVVPKQTSRAVIFIENGKRVAKSTVLG